VIDRDVKGLYKKAMNGEIPNFTGISDPFEAPANPDIHVRTDQQTPEESAQYILSVLEEKGFV
jgi:adenylylsulfate kinase-like enzyme